MGEKKPTGEQSNTENKGGLAPEYHGALNKAAILYPGGKVAQDALIAKLRQIYAGDPLALKQIDVYDEESPYRIKAEELRQAYLREDTQAQTELHAWFDEHYPNIKK